jgi:hypothetical protein
MWLPENISSGISSIVVAEPCNYSIPSPDSGISGDFVVDLGQARVDSAITCTVGVADGGFS